LGKPLTLVFGDAARAVLPKRYRLGGTAAAVLSQVVVGIGTDKKNGLTLG